MIYNLKLYWVYKENTFLKFEVIQCLRKLTFGLVKESCYGVGVVVGGMGVLAIEISTSPLPSKMSCINDGSARPRKIIISA